MAQTVEKLITPYDKTIDTVFNTSNSYYIDIYQREYKWQQKQVQTLLNDIQVRFDVGIIREKNPDRIQEDVLGNFEPYFVNTFLTNEIPGKKNIVDGQQRLTTFLIILIKFYQVSIKEHKKNPDVGIYGAGFIENRIYESGAFGTKKFKIHNSNREKAFSAILSETHFEFDNPDETQNRIIENYNFISKYYDKFLYDSNGNFNSVKFNYYLTYLLYRINIVEIEIKSSPNSNNVAMIFEVVNDRGLGLKPFEILKGKFLGDLDEKQKESANKVWGEILDLHYREYLDVDDFFKLYFRAKFTKNISEYERMEHDYHYEVYKNENIRKYFNDFKDKKNLYDFVTKELKYFSDLYLELRKSKDYRFVLYNRMLEQDQQYLLILSAIKFNDSQKSNKIEKVSKKFDQMYVMFRLKGYESKDFQPFILDICPTIREKKYEDIDSIFDSIFIKKLEEHETIPKSTFKKISDIFNTLDDKSLIHKNKNLSKYILLRIDETLSKLLGRASLVTDSTIDLEGLFNINNRSYELHLEHMFADNERNKVLFLNEENEFDYTKFNNLRNQFGALLILKDKHNLSSGNDVYEDKIDIYSKSNIIWNEILVGQVPKVDLKRLPFGLSFQVQKPNKDGLLDLSAIETRQKELFELVKYTWTNGF